MRIADVALSETRFDDAIALAPDAPGAYRVVYTTMNAEMQKGAYEAVVNGQGAGKRDPKMAAASFCCSVINSYCADCCRTSCFC